METLAILNKTRAWLIGGLAFTVTASLYGGNFTMTQYDLEGSHAIPSSTESLTFAKVKGKGLEVKWFAPLAGDVIGSVVFNDTVYVPTLDFFTGGGNLYSINGKDGSTNWSQPVAGGAAMALVNDKSVYVSSFGLGAISKLDRKTGALQWTYNPNSPVPHSVIGGMTVITNPKTGRDMLVYPLNPQDESFQNLLTPGISAIIALDAGTGQEIWKFYPVCASNVPCSMLPVYQNGNLISTSWVGGAGSWGNAISYSKSQKLLFFGTGQNASSVGFNNASPGSDSIFAINASDGSFVWQNQVKQGDIFNFIQAFDPANPLDMDIGDAPALFRHMGHEYLSVGSKRGYFYVLDTTDGSIVNKPQSGPLVDSIGFKKGLLLSSAYAGPVIGVGTDGGVNIDSGFYKGKDGAVIHFGIHHDYLQGNTAVVNGVPPWNGQAAIPPFPAYPAGVCFGLGVLAPLPNGCPAADSGNLYLVDSLGTTVLGTYTNTAGLLNAPVYLDNMILLYKDSYPNYDPNNPGVAKYNSPNNQLVVVDVSDPTAPTLLESVDLIDPNNSSNLANSFFGGLVAISNGQIYLGSGFFGANATKGIFAIGLK